MKAYLIIAPFLLGVAMAGYDPYTDLAQLYRMQLLADAFGDYIPENMPLDDNNDIEIRSYWPEFAASLDDSQANPSNNMYNSPMYSGAHIRDQEHIEHSALHGYQSVSGGTAEGPANNKLQKSDKPLPAYCNPPNPCPIGKTSKDNCVEDFENSAENNKKLLSEQDCPCDTEHMFSCPAGRETVSSKGNSGYQQTLNKVIDQLSKIGAEEEENGGPLNPARKRISMVAKKSPHIIHKRAENAPNPFLKGTPMAIAAKKDSKSSQSSMGNLMAQWIKDRYGQGYGDQFGNQFGDQFGELYGDQE